MSVKTVPRYLSYYGTVKQLTFMHDNFISQFNTKDINWFAGDLFSRSRCTRLSGKWSLSPATYIYKGKFSLQVMWTSLQMLLLKEPAKYETNKYLFYLNSSN